MQFAFDIGPVNGDMFNSSFNLVKFSPLRTPEIQKVAAKRRSGEDGYVSSSSVASSVTHEILGISQSIQKKLASENKNKKTGIDTRGDRSSGEEDELFITQKFSPQINKTETTAGTNMTKKKASVQSRTHDGFTEHDSNNNSPVKTQTKETKMKLQVTGKEKHGKVQHSKEMTKQDSSPLSSRSSSGAHKSSPHKVSSSKGTKEPEQTKSRKSKTQSVSSSSDDDSDSSSDSEIDEAKCRILMERLRAKAATDYNSESESDNEIIHQSSQKLTKEQVKDKYKTDEPTEAQSPVNFSQDLFSPKSDDDSDGDSVDTVRKSGRKPGKRQKLSPKGDKKYSKGAGKQDSEIDSDGEAEKLHSMSKDSNDQHKENKNNHELVNRLDEEAAVQGSSGSDSDSDSSMSDANDTVIEAKKTDTTGKSSSEDDSGSDLSDVADRPVNKMAKSSDTSSDSEGERDSVEKLTQNAGVCSPKTSSSDSESQSDSDSKHNTGKETNFTSLKNQSSDLEDDVDYMSSNTGKKADTSHKADNSEAPASDSDSDIGSVSDNNPEVTNKTDKVKTTTISSTELSSPRGSGQQMQRSPYRSTRQSKITDHCPPAASEAKRRKMRYKPPEGFDIDDDLDKYATQEEVNGKQIWLIQTPVDFDIDTLNNQKIKLEGIQTLRTKTKSEKQYEVVSRCSKDNRNVGCSVVYDKEGKPLLDASISGQIQVLDWIPGIPPVEIEVPAQDKHRVPDNLRVRYVPFGSESPKRVDEPVDSKSEKHGSKRKHDRSLEEVKKKKKKSKRESRGEMN